MGMLAYMIWYFEPTVRSTWSIFDNVRISERRRLDYVAWWFGDLK